MTLMMIWEWIRKVKHERKEMRNESKKKSRTGKRKRNEGKKGWKERERMKTSWHTFVNVDLNQHILFLEAGQNFVT